MRKLSNVILKGEMMGVLEKIEDNKILLIDDDEWIRGSLLLFFKGENCYCDVVETAEEGLELLKSRTYNIILVDYRLPGMNGVDFLRQIRSSQPGVVKILITAYGSEKIFSEAKAAGVNECIEKPLTVDSLEQSLSRLVEGHA